MRASYEQNRVGHGVHHHDGQTHQGSPEQNTFHIPHLSVSGPHTLPLRPIPRTVGLSVPDRIPRRQHIPGCKGPGAAASLPGGWETLRHWVCGERGGVSGQMSLSASLDTSLLPGSLMSAQTEAASLCLRGARTRAVPSKWSFESRIFLPLISE